MLIHITAHKAGNTGTGFQGSRHFRTTQIQITVFQALFFGVGLVEIQRQRLCAVDDFQAMCEHFDFAGCHVFIDLAFRTGTHHTGHTNTEFITQL